MSASITGKYGMIFHNEKDGNKWYTLSDSSKNVDGTFTNYPWRVRFKGDIPNDRTKIKYEGFFSYYQKEKGTPVYATIQCMEWEYVEQPNQDTFSSDTAIDIGEDSLPF